MQQTTLGLRDRQRLQTLRDLHQAAVDLALEGGLAAATVEAITDRAGVSRRTFFNYYPTKEDALLGTTSPVVPEDALEQFLSHSADDAFAEALRLVVAIIRSTHLVELPVGLRGKLLLEFPSLKVRLSQHIAAAEGLIATALDERAAAGATSSGAQDPETASALVTLASAVLRFAYLREPGATSPSPEAVDAAISVFRHVLQEMS